MCTFSHVQFCSPMNCSPLVSSVHGLFQARILEWVAMPFSRASSWPRDRTPISCIGRQILYHCVTWMIQGFFTSILLFQDFPGGSEGKASVYNEGDPGSIPGSGWSPGEGNGNPLQYSCLENPMDGGIWSATVHGVGKSWTWLSDFTHSLTHAIFCFFCVLKKRKGNLGETENTWKEDKMGVIATNCRQS